MPGSQFRAGGNQVHLLTAVLVAAAVILLFKVVGPLHQLQAPGHIPWWVLIPMFFGAEVFVVHIQFRRDAHSFSLSELPLVAELSSHRRLWWCCRW